MTIYVVEKPSKATLIFVAYTSVWLLSPKFYISVYLITIFLPAQSTSVQRFPFLPLFRSIPRLVAGKS
jgi:hypothetical protein